MKFFIIGGVAVVALIAGYWLGSVVLAKAIQPKIKEIEKTQAIDRANYLFTLRREIANILVWQDPQRYCKLYQDLCSELNSLKSWRQEELNKRLNELSLKYPFYHDFDIFENKEYVYIRMLFGSNMMSLN